MPYIKPITDLRKTTEISQACHEINEPIFITKNGYGDLAVMSIETYESLLGASDLIQHIKDAENQYKKTHKTLDAQHALNTLREVHLG